MPKTMSSQRTRISLTTLLLILVPTLWPPNLSAQSLPPQRIVWQKIPIAIMLNVGEERMVHFRSPVSIGMPGALESLLRTQSVNGTVYLMAKAPFASSRVLVREIDSGQTYLLDLSAINSATNSGNATPIVVTLDEAAALGSRLRENGQDTLHGPVSLTRFAAQQLYAPLRLLAATPGIVRVPIQQRIIALVPGDAVEAKTLAGWRAGVLYVTAVKLTNRTPRAQTLDPRILRGAWLTAAFQHSRLLPAGDEADTTAVYLVSAQPFNAAL